MGGPIERGRVMDFSYELPISQLKFNLKSNVIPIGHITTGIHLHRALLFKVQDFKNVCVHLLIGICLLSSFICLHFESISVFVCELLPLLLC